MISNHAGFTLSRPSSGRSVIGLRKWHKMTSPYARSEYVPEMSCNGRCDGCSAVDHVPGILVAKDRASSYCSPTNSRRGRSNQYPARMTGAPDPAYRDFQFSASNPSSRSRIMYCAAFAYVEPKSLSFVMIAIPKPARGASAMRVFWPGSAPKWSRIWVPR